MNMDAVVTGLIFLLRAIVIIVATVLLRFMKNLRDVQTRREKLIRSQQRDGSTITGNDTSSENLFYTGGEQKKTRIVSVLGSGGHTAEMMSLMPELFETLVSTKKVNLEVTYLSGETDHHSVTKVKTMHTDLGNIEDVSFEVLPRAREVGQSWISSIWTSIHTSIWAFLLIVKVKPDLIVINGPGTSAIVAGIAFLHRALLPRVFRGRCHVIYVESFARVETLSLSGKLVYHFADRFLIQWQQLEREWPLSEYYGRLC